MLGRFSTMQLWARLFKMANSFFCRLFPAVDTLRPPPPFFLVRSFVSRLQTILYSIQPLVLLAVSTNIEASLEVL